MVSKVLPYVYLVPYRPSKAVAALKASSSCEFRVDRIQLWISKQLVLDFFTPKSHQLCFIHARSTGVTVGVEHHLRVAMDGQKGLEIAVRLRKIHNGPDLRLRVSTHSTVRLRARVTTGTSTWWVKAIISDSTISSKTSYSVRMTWTCRCRTSKRCTPVPVWVDTDTRGANVYPSRFAPHAVLKTGWRKISLWSWRRFQFELHLTQAVSGVNIVKAVLILHQRRVS